jgi:hypothetical protein
VYVNGSQVTAFSGTAITQNADTKINSAVSHQLGRYAASASEYFDGYMTDINFIDGQALTPNSFGTSNGLGVWQPIRYGGSYGTNGFYLPFNYNGTTSTYGGSFNGSSQYLTIAQNAAFNMGSGDFTLESWVYFNASGRAAILSQLDSVGTNSSCSFYFERNASNFLRILVASGSTGYEVTGTTVVPSGQWIHVAGVRNGNNLSCYLNGVLQGTVSVTGVSLNSSTENVQINGYGTSTGLVFAGAMSNTRIVKGTAVYTSNFTPPTANLTAISGTSLLTLQNATIVDNSTNAFTITNTGTVVTYVGYPFYLNIAKDQSPNGNNWTPNAVNSGLPSGSNYDSMTDVPTLTSATAANYCVFNPVIAGTTNLINGNLTRNGAVRTNVGTMFLTGGKYYFETTIQDSNGNGGVGVKQSTAYPLEGYDTSKCATYFANGEYKIEGASQTSGFSSFTNGDIIGIAVDTTQSPAKIWFAKNNTWQGTGNPTTAGYSLTSGLEYYFMVLHGSGSSSTTASSNFGQQGFTYTPPTGFVALNTFNLPTPTIGATASTQANKYMDANTYAGNGQAISSGGMVISSLNFQPDFVWIKDRTSPYSHNLSDVLRGASTRVYSNLTNAEDTNTESVNTFNSNGFTVGNNVGVNTNGNGYVSWNWKANGSGSTNTAGSITSTVSANTSAGFSVVTYTGNGTASQTCGHGLGVTPSMVIWKNRNDVDAWIVYHSALTTSEYLVLNTTAAKATVSGLFTGISSTVLPLNNVSAAINANGFNYVAYCFAPIAGYSAFGSYTGNGVADGPFIYTGFRPRYYILKNITNAQSWSVQDTSRSPYNVGSAVLLPNSSSAELTGTDFVDILSNGFKIRHSSSGNNNNSGDTYIYMAFAENPFKYANAR